MLGLLPLVILGSVSGLIGGVLLLINKRAANYLSRYAVAFATGVLLAVSFLDLLPEAVSGMGESAFPLMLLAFVALFLFERFIVYIHHHDGDGHIHSTVQLVLIGDTIHNFLDGVAIAAAYVVDPSLAFFIAVATFFHETPHEIADFGILLSAGWTRKKTFIANLISASATIPGAVITYFLASTTETIVPILITIAASLFLYISTADLLPQITRVHKERDSWLNVFYLILGIIIIYLLGTILPE